MKHSIIDKILTEWSYRVHDGMPNPKNHLHLVHLKETLKYLKIDEKVIDIMMNNLYEDKDDKYVSIGWGKYKEKDVMLHIGPYGKYMKYDGKNYRIDKLRNHSLETLCSLL